MASLADMLSGSFDAVEKAGKTPRAGSLAEALLFYTAPPSDRNKRYTKGRARSKNVEVRGKEEIDLIDRLVLQAMNGVGNIDQLSGFAALRTPVRKLTGGPGPQGIDTSYQPPVPAGPHDLRLPQPSTVVGSEMVLENGKFVTRLRFAPTAGAEAQAMLSEPDRAEALRKRGIAFKDGKFVPLS